MGGGGGCKNIAGVFFSNMYDPPIPKKMVAPFNTILAFVKGSVLSGIGHW